MADISYSSLGGEAQGLISADCSTFDSVGNKTQPGHKDQIMVYALMHSISRNQNANHHELIITKLVDKSSPSLAKALSDNEKMATREFILYRISKTGIYQPYYKMNLPKAQISSIDFVTLHIVLEKELEPQERIAFIYENISWEHILVGTNVMSKWQDCAQ